MTDFVPLLLALPREDDLLLLWRSCVPQLYSERIFPLHFVGQCACGEGEQRDAAQGCRACHSSPSPVPLAVVLSLRESCPLSLLFLKLCTAQQQQPALLCDTTCSPNAALPEGLGQHRLSQELSATEGVHSAGECTGLAAEPWKKRGRGHVLHHATKNQLL